MRTRLGEKLLGRMAGTPGCGTFYTRSSTGSLQRPPEEDLPALAEGRGEKRPLLKAAVCSVLLKEAA